MNLNRCERCGSFFASKNSVCPNCQSKDEHEINHLKTFLSEADSSVTVESLAESTGVSLKNVNKQYKGNNKIRSLINYVFQIESYIYFMNKEKIAVFVKEEEHL